MLLWWKREEEKECVCNPSSLKRYKRILRKNASCSLSRKAIYAEFSCCRDLCKESCKDIEFIKTEINNAVEYIHRH